jgi:hypothetical protein
MQLLLYQGNLCSPTSYKALCQSAMHHYNESHSLSTNAMAQ